MHMGVFFMWHFKWRRWPIECKLLVIRPTAYRDRSLYFQFNREAQERLHYLDTILLKDAAVHQDIYRSLVGCSHHLEIPLFVRVIRTTIIMCRYVYVQADRKTSNLHNLSPFLRVLVLEPVIQ